MEERTDPTGRILTCHVVRERPGRQVLVGVRMVLDRWRLRRVTGLRWAKVLGTGRGADVVASFDPRRQVYLLVWDDQASAERFVAEHRIPARWRHLEVQFEGAFGLVSGYGSWSGRDVLDGMRRVDAGDGPVVVVTRARVRLRSWRAFRRASRAHRHVADQPGVEWVMGVGELPVLRIGTLSRWASAEAVDRFVAGDRVHGSAMTYATEWFGESMFARFASVDVDGFGRGERWSVVIGGPW